MAHSADLIRDARRGQLAAQMPPRPALRHRLAVRCGLLLISGGRRLTRSAYAAHLRQTRGGHFAPAEEPELLARDIAAFFAAL